MQSGILQFKKGTGRIIHIILWELSSKLHDVFKWDMADEEGAWIDAGEDRDAKG